MIHTFCCHHLTPAIRLQTHTQWEVENHFITVTAAIDTLVINHYWMGMQLSGSTWYLLDGTVLGNGAPSNANPYAHM